MLGGDAEDLLSFPSGIWMYSRCCGLNHACFNGEFTPFSIKASFLLSQCRLVPKSIKYLLLLLLSYYKLKSKMIACCFAPTKMELSMLSSHNPEVQNQWPKWQSYSPLSRAPDTQRIKTDNDFALPDHNLQRLQLTGALCEDHLLSIHPFVTLYLKSKEEGRENCHLIESER